MPTFNVVRSGSLLLVHTPDSDEYTISTFSFDNTIFHVVLFNYDLYCRPWFVGTEICNYLNIEFHTISNIILLRHESGEICNSNPLVPLDLDTCIIVISISGVFKLINKSKNDTVKFASWIYDVVLPTIRQHSKYNYFE